MAGRIPKNGDAGGHGAAPRRAYPFTAIVGQEDLKLALLLSVIAPAVGGVLVMGHRGTAKSTAVRALAELLPPLTAVRDCLYNCDPRDAQQLCGGCRDLFAARRRPPPRESRPVPVVDLPLGATEDRVCGTIDVERALRDGIKSFEPGLLARANRGFLYIDEVNLLEDHLVDLLLDVAATGRNMVEREGVSAEHPSRFVLVGSGNPEEGELRPQLLDRFGLFTEVETILDLDSRVLIVERREEFERDPERFAAVFEAGQAALRGRLARARRGYVRIEITRPLLRSIAELCVRLGVDGHRGEITIARAARAHAALGGRRRASAEDVRRVAAMCLRHRLRRDPLEQRSGGGMVDEAVEEIFGRAEEVEPETRRRRPPDPDDAAGAGDGGGGAHTPSGRREDETTPDGRAGDTRRSEGKIIPPAEAGLPEGAFAPEPAPAKANELKAAHAARGRGARRTDYAPRGRYARAAATKEAGSRVALDATVRAAAPSLARRRRDSSPSVGRVDASDLRYKRYRRKAGKLYILAVDTSGSMAVNRISQAKGALAHLLRRSYVERDRVALVCFGGRDARLHLPPSGSPARARRILDALPVGGGTPLAAGLARALEVARRAAAEGARQTILALFTDGRANVALVEGVDAGAEARRRRIGAEITSLGAALRRAGVTSVVVDTRNRFTSGGEGSRLADALGGRHVYLPQSPTAASVSGVFGDS